MPSSTNTSERINLLHKVAKDLLKQGKSEEEIVRQLTSQGIEPSYARTIQANVYNDKSDRKNFWKLIAGGAFFIAGGIAINYYSYKIADNSHSTFFYLFWGIIVVGIVLIIKAFTIFRK